MFSDSVFDKTNSEVSRSGREKYKSKNVKAAEKSAKTNSQSQFSTGKFREDKKLFQPSVNQITNIIFEMSFEILMWSDVTHLNLEFVINDKKF